MIRLKNIRTIQTFNKRGLFYNLMLSIYCVFNYKILFNFNSFSFLSRKEEGKKSVKKSMMLFQTWRESMRHASN